MRPLLVCLYLLWAPSCLPADRCDLHQVRRNGACVCADGAAPPASGVGDCVPCGDHEHVDGTTCACDDGYAADANGVCQVVPTGEGDACSPTMTCTAARYPVCHDTPNAGSYCTATGCASAADCDGGYSCDQTTMPSFCKRPPTGLDHPCTSAMDCATFDASYCEMIQSHTCQVSGCTKTPDNCQVGSACCDLTQFGLPTLCVPVGMCPT